MDPPAYLSLQAPPPLRSCLLLSRRVCVPSAEVSGRCSFLPGLSRPALGHMTYFRVRRSAAVVGARLRSCFGLVVSGREGAGAVLSFLWPWTRRRRGGDRPGASVADQKLVHLSPPRSVLGVDGACPASVLPRQSRGTVGTHLPGFLCPGSEAAPCEGPSPGPSFCGARGLSWVGAGGSSRETLTARFSPPQPARNSAGWPPGSGQLRVG